MRTVKTMIEGKELEIDICDNCEQAIVAYGDCKPKAVREEFCEKCQKTFDIKVTTYNRNRARKQKMSMLLIRR